MSNMAAAPCFTLDPEQQRELCTHAVHARRLYDAALAESDSSKQNALLLEANIIAQGVGYESFESGTSADRMIAEVPELLQSFQYGWAFASDCGKSL